MPAARLDELSADNYAMELFSDEDVLDTITAMMVCHRYLTDEYWPVMRKIMSREEEVFEDLHSGMASVLRKMLKSAKVTRWLAKTVSAEARWDNDVPSLAIRAENIGHTQARMSIADTESAAGVYLDSALDKRLGSD